MVIDPAMFAPDVSPLDMLTSPDDPPDAEPVAIDMAPLTPDEPLFADFISIAPLVDPVPAPESTDTEPPVLDEDPPDDT